MDFEWTVREVCFRSPAWILGNVPLGLPCTNLINSLLSLRLELCHTGLGRWQLKSCLCECWYCSWQISISLLHLDPGSSVHWQYFLRYSPSPDFLVGAPWPTKTPEVEIENPENRLSFKSYCQRFVEWCQIFSRCIELFEIFLIRVSCLRYFRDVLNYLRYFR